MISVIIPTYNREHTLRRSIESVLSQTYTDLELIIADDCSTDGTKKLIEGIDDTRIKYICLKKNGGACVARNAGIAVAKGDYIAFQDSDDIWLANKLEIQFKTIVETGADVCFHKLIRHYEGSAKDALFPDLDKSGFLSHEDMSNSPLISTQTIMAKREVFLEHQFDPLVKKTQDYDWGIRASRNHTFYYLDMPLAEQYYQGDSISGKGLKIVRDTRQYFLEKYADECKVNTHFEIYQLQVIARSKALLGENPSEEFKRIYRLSGRKSDYFRFVLSKLGLMKLMYMMKGYKNQTLPMK